MIKYLLLLSLFLLSCESKESISTDINVLKKERALIKNQIAIANSRLTRLDSETKRKVEKLKIVNIYLNGNTPKYTLTLRCKQERLSLSIDSHIKDELNAFEFDILVDKTLYDRLSIGSDIINNFRMGSFLMNSSVSNWTLKVTRKRIQ